MQFSGGIVAAPGAVNLNRAMMHAMLAIHADDYGYFPSYDAGIVEAARAGAIDGASVMAMREPNPAPLLETGVAVGLHVEATASLEEQLTAFARLIGRAPEYIDGHHHAHASGGLAEEVAEVAARLGIPVRSVDQRHRALLRGRGVATPDRLLGRLTESEPALPPGIEAWLSGGEAPGGVTEWMVHPGHPDESTGSDYDAGRGEDLALLLELGDRERWAERGISRGSLARAPGA